MITLKIGKLEIEVDGDSVKITAPENLLVQKYQLISYGSQGRYSITTPLTRAEVLEYLEDGEPAIEKRCYNCKHSENYTLSTPCKNCGLLGANGLRSYREWQPMPTAKPSRYDWPNAPEEARYATTDTSGRIDFWATKPEKHSYHGERVSWGGAESPVICSTKMETWQPCSDAADSLEARPM